MIAITRVPLDQGQEVLLLGNDPADTYQGWIVAREGDLVWLAPRPEEHDGPLAPGREVALHTWRWGDALYTLRARVVSDPPRVGAGVGVRLIEGARIQRRAYFRVPLARAADAAQVLPAHGPSRPIALHLEDISAGGLRASVPGTSDAPPLAAGDALEITVSLPGLPAPLTLGGRVVRVARRPHRPADGWECGIVFPVLAPTVREHLVQFALREQREQRRRGVL